MAKESWTAAEEARLRELYPTHLTRELAGILASEGFPARSTKAIVSRSRLLGLHKDPAFDSWGSLRTWTEEEDQFLREFVPGHTEREVIDAFGERFGRRITHGQYTNRRYALGLKQGTVGYRWQKGHVPWVKGKKFPGKTNSGSFKKGLRPHNMRERLDIRLDPEGYSYIKVDPRNAKHTMGYWIPYAHFVWMQHHGRDWPEGHKAIFADRDRTNFSPENIVAVPNDIYPRVACESKGGIGFWDAESLEIAINVARISKERHRLERIKREHQQSRD